jgi:tetratricopeptide (TPR) repeat protein
MTISRAVLAATLIAGGAWAHAAPAAAQSAFESLRAQQRARQQQQQQPSEQQPQQPQQSRIASLSRAENDALRPLMTAVQAHDWVGATAAVPAAQAAVQSPAARYAVGQLMLEIGRGQPSEPMQAQAVDAMLASGAAPAELVPQLLAAQTGFALQTNNFAAAESSLTRLVALTPSDVTRLTQLAQVKIRLNKRQEAYDLYRRVLQMGETGGQHAAEPLYRQTLALAYEGHMVAPALELSRTLVTAYPTPENWRTALGVFRDLAGESGGADLDIGRLMRAAGVLTSERDYFVYAQAANRAGLPGEVKAVVEEGLGRNVFQASAADARAMLTSASGQIGEDRASLARLRTQALAAAEGRIARRTGDALYGYGQYAEAAELYRAALQKGGEDPGLVNVRLGSALAMAGQRTEAEAAFRAVTSGDRVELARFWLLWLSTHQG